MGVTFICVHFKAEKACTDLAKKRKKDWRPKDHELFGKLDLWVSIQSIFMISMQFPSAAETRVADPGRVDQIRIRPSRKTGSGSDPRKATIFNFDLIKSTLVETNATYYPLWQTGYLDSHIGIHGHY